MTQQHLTARNLYELLAEVLARVEPQRILDIGCGEGALRAALPVALGSRIVGLDASATMLDAHPAPAIQADAIALAFLAGAFDAAVAVNVLDHLAEPTFAIGEAHRVLAVGGSFLAATASRHDSPELAMVWRPPPSSFDAEDAPGLVASVFGQVQVQRWDGPLMRLPDTLAVGDYLIAWLVAPEVAAAAGQVTTPVTVTKRGAVIHARK